MELITTDIIKWQYPVITEKYACEQLSAADPISAKNYIYLGIPWATLLDLYGKIFNKYFDTFKDFAVDKLKWNQISFPQSKIISVCQTIHFRTALPFFSEIGITHLFCSHALKEEYRKFKKEYKIKVLPFTLYPAMITHSIKNDKRDYLYSFIGCVSYLNFSKDAERGTKVRQEIYHLNHHKNSKVISRPNWHFNDIVYEKQILGRIIPPETEMLLSLQGKEYKEILANSRFSLCPRGTGPNSIRIWESLGAGAIPVIIADNLWLPKNPIGWDSCVIFVKENNISKLVETIESVSFEKEEILRNNGYKTYELFMNSNFCRPISDYFHLRKKNILYRLLDLISS